MRRPWSSREWSGARGEPAQWAVTPGGAAPRGKTASEVIKSREEQGGIGFNRLGNEWWLWQKLSQFCEENRSQRTVAGGANSGWGTEQSPVFPEALLWSKGEGPWSEEGSRAREESGSSTRRKYLRTGRERRLGWQRSLIGKEWVQNTGGWVDVASKKGGSALRPCKEGWGQTERSEDKNVKVFLRNDVYFPTEVSKFASVQREEGIVGEGHFRKVGKMHFTDMHVPSPPAVMGHSFQELTCVGPGLSTFSQPLSFISIATLCGRCHHPHLTEDKSRGSKRLSHWSKIYKFPAECSISICWMDYGWTNKYLLNE